MLGTLITFAAGYAVAHYLPWGTVWGWLKGWFA